MSKVTARALPLVYTAMELGQAMKADYGDDADGQSNPLQFYADAFMENQSEAGYSEARPHGRRSVRALANIIRVRPSHLRLVKEELGYERKDYYDVALADTIVSSLEKWAPGAEAFKLLKAPKTAKPFKGPYYARRTELRLKRTSNWPFHCTLVGERSPELQQSIIALAGLFRVNKADLGVIAKQFTSIGTPEEKLEACLAEVILESVRTEQRFAHTLGASAD